MLRKTYIALSGTLFLIGFVLMLNSQFDTIGSATGILIADVSTLSSLGIFLIIIAGIVFLAGHSELEKRIILTSVIHKDAGLKRLAEEATRNEQVQRELDHLAYELSRGNIDAGLKPHGHIEGTDIFYLRGVKGGRLYCRKIEEGYEIVGKSAKGGNQGKVMRKLKELYER